MILTLGDLTLDIVMKPHRRPAGATATSPGSVTMTSGGAAANFAVWVARLGGGPRFIGKVGSDPAANLLTYDLLKEGVLPETVVQEGSTATLSHIVRPHGGVELHPDRGVAVNLRADELAEEWFAGAQWLHLPAPSLLALPIGTAAARAVRLTRQAGGKISIDLSPAKDLKDYGAGKLAVLLKTIRPDVVFTGEAEAAMFAAGVLGELAGTSVLKLNDGGCGLADAKGYREFPAAKLRTVDRTGASDAFDAAWCLTYLATGSAEAACRKAVLLQARVAAQHGTRPEVDVTDIAVS